MTIANQLRCHTLTLCKALAISVGLLAATHDVVNANSLPTQADFDVALDSDVIDPAKLKGNTLEIVQRRGRRGNDGTASNFVGLGLSLGTGDGDGALEELGLTAISKLSFTPQLSARPTLVFNDSAAVLVPVTYNFQSPTEVLNASLFPYVGGGLAINATEDDIAPLVSVGIDVPVSERLTLNGQSNITLADDITINFMVGLGYNIGDLF
ncbi:MAG: hypothetical protein KTR27_02155 [Leptolyngbyaceae cyanobacterium MAG.088]|nr:hypothetical protein [Leptolyngbyaceae cyanobacterium MAG.088]